MTDPKEALIERLRKPHYLGDDPKARLPEAAADLIFLLRRERREAADALASLSASVGVTDEMVERAARAMEPMAFREEYTATDEMYEFEQEGRAQALGRARAALEAALSLPSSGGEVVGWTNQEALDVLSMKGADEPYEQPIWSDYGPGHTIPLYARATESGK